MISEILEEASKLKSREKKIEFLRSYDSITLRRILSAVYDERCKWLLPDSDPPYHAAHPAFGHEKLYSESRKLYLFLEGGNPNLKQNRRETMFIEFLESIHPREASMMLKIKKKKMPYPGINEDLVREAFPDLLLPKETAQERTEEPTHVENTEAPQALG